uniref:Cathepsin B1 n=1 Tax=Tetranychus truncatus TaxID=93132 RepID=A0A3G5ANV0_9ACAR|nr:cathepsin B1 [Tetranychus truncatus]
MMKSNVGPNGYNNSADIGKAYKYWAKNGIFTVELTEESSCLPFSQKCQPMEIKLNRYFKVVNNFFEYEHEMRSSIMMDGPVSAYMEIYSDFLSYKSGIYRRLNSRSLGASDIKIIGWGTENGVDYWLAVNQWGTEWGEEGFFKLLAGEEQLGYVPSPITPSLVAVDIVQDIPKSYVHSQLFYLAK